jgi:alpha-beta hydrolase superfamily lysophospholipase
MKRFSRYAGWSVAALVLSIGAAVGWLKLHEDALVFATARSKLHVVGELPRNVERVSVTLPGAIALAGVLFRAEPPADAGYWVLHLHGNAESAFSRSQLEHCEILRRAGFSVMDIDYRGFGLSPGSASETAMEGDAEAAFAALLERGVPQERIIVLGHSLGSGPAVLLAMRHRPAALVLFGAFTSIADAAADRYPLLPVRYFTSVRFDSLARIGQVHVPVIVVHSRADTVIPYSHALRLYAAAGDPKRLVSLDAPADDEFGGHVDSLFQNIPALKTALAAVLPQPAVPVQHGNGGS